MTRTCKECHNRYSVDLVLCYSPVRMVIKRKRRVLYERRTKTVTDGRAWHGKVCPDCKQAMNRGSA